MSEVLPAGLEYKRLVKAYMALTEIQDEIQRYKQSAIDRILYEDIDKTELVRLQTIAKFANDLLLLIEQIMGGINDGDDTDADTAAYEQPATVV